jgi:hypothetical protein
MLGKLSKWLRIMGHDTYYQVSYEEEAIQKSIQEGRVFLSRRARISEEHTGALRVHSAHVGQQLRELVERDVLTLNRAEWFRICLVCNVPLRKAAGEISMESVPDYVLHHKSSDIRWCPACRRLFWAGTHRENMIRQLEKWGF